MNVITNDEEEFALESFFSEYIGILKESEGETEINIDVSAEDFLLVVDFVEWKHKKDNGENIPPPNFTKEEKDSLLLVSEPLKIPAIKELEENKATKYKEYSWEEICKHSVESDCWVVIDGCVYDCTKWLPGHPGGDQLLLGVQKDATFMFELFHRSTYSFKILQKYFIGTVKPSDMEKVLETQTEIPSNDFMEKLKKLRGPP